MYNPFSLEGKTVLVTGASSGIGRGIAVECSRLGATVVVNGRSLDRLNETLALMEGNSHFFIAGDLSMEECRQEIAEKVPKLNGVVYCAGISQIRMSKYIDSDSLQGVFNVNAFAPILLNAHLLKCKKIQKGASLIFISSISGVYKSQIGEGGYGATKAAISGFVKSAALELAPYGTRVNCIHPGVVETPLLNVSNEMLGAEELTELKSKYPLNRFGKPEDVAHAAAYLLSDASSWVTGINLLVDGGFCLK